MRRLTVNLGVLVLVAVLVVGLTQAGGGDGGVDSGDSSGTARWPFPSYDDPDEDIAKSIRAPANYPVTVFFDRSGRLVYIRQGGYRRESDLAADMQRYLAG